MTTCSRDTRGKEASSLAAPPECPISDLWCPHQGSHAASELAPTEYLSFSAQSSQLRAGAAGSTAGKYEERVLWEPFLPQSWWPFSVSRASTKGTMYMVVFLRGSQSSRFWESWHSGGCDPAPCQRKVIEEGFVSAQIPGDSPSLWGRHSRRILGQLAPSQPQGRAERTSSHMVLD